MTEHDSDPTDRTRSPHAASPYPLSRMSARHDLIDVARENVLLILHSKLGRWLQPGGHVDADDPSVIAAACREVLEETGLDVSPLAANLLDVDVHAIPARSAMPSHEHFDVRFAFQAAHTDARAGSDATQARWVPIAELLAGGPQLPTDESVLRAVRKLSRRIS
jgi:8-oxo-dGTP pyrophosphatase MutT (NUDIX family)